ncbi:HNH endonuclease signature motif containing protein [Williamsia sterculiae]|nr:HNH endonuclease signature motif containing protein [Williamsia sterculiae]
MSESRWAGESPAAFGLLGDVEGAPVNDLLAEMVHATAGQSFLEWQRYRIAAELDSQLVGEEVLTDYRMIDSTALCAARIATVLSISQVAAEGLLARAVALRDRLPQVLLCLRDGKVAPQHIRTIVSRTDLITDETIAAMVDAEIAECLRRRGSWSPNRLRDMVDRTVYTHDPDAVRERRQVAKDARAFWTDNDADGMGTVGASMTAENTLLLAQRVHAAADHVCKNDPRTTAARRSDALVALTTGIPWECLCGDPDCTAAQGWDATPTGPGTSVVVHVVADTTAHLKHGGKPGFMPGHGVVSAEHVRDLVKRPDTIIRPLPTTAPAAQPADPYRPSAALQRFLWIRDHYCVWPGCNQPAIRCEADHVTEYDHTNPERGGQTTPEDMNSKCPFHHGVKTFSEFLDDQTIDDHGRPEVTITTPEGVTVDGPAHTGFDLHPQLDHIEFTAPPNGPPPSTPEPPTRRRPRLEDKHVRRRTERERNRCAREQDDTTDPPPF